MKKQALTDVVMYGCLAVSCCTLAYVAYRVALVWWITR
jgi:hypothetical protein